MKGGGYKVKTQTSAHEAASRLARNVKVRARLKELQEGVTRRVVKSRAEVLSDLACNAVTTFVDRQYARPNQALLGFGRGGQFPDA